MSIEDFHAYWKDEHAPFFANTPEVRKLISRYELNHRIPEDYERARHPTEVAGPQWDGVAVQWFNSFDDFLALTRLPAYLEFAGPDAQRYRAPETAVVFTHDAIRIVEKPVNRADAQVKLICLLRRSAALDRPTFFKHWREHHGGLFQNIPELNEPLWGYDQNHGLDLEGAQFDGITEQWFASLTEWIASISVPVNDTKVIPDVAYMLDPASIQFILGGKPTVVIG